MQPQCVAQRPKGPGYANKEAEQDEQPLPLQHLVDQWQEDGSRKEYPPYKDLDDLLSNPEVSLQVLDVLRFNKVGITW